MKKFLLLFFAFSLLGNWAVQAQNRFSTAGYYAMKNSGRSVKDFNVGWRFHKGDVSQGEKTDLDDHNWAIVNLPHSVELVPFEASGSKNYQGPAWYRKRIKLGSEYAGKDVTIHFEGVMGKSSYYVNGKKVKDQFGGFLPVTINLTDAGIKIGEEALIAVYADNSDDPMYPPGKPQYVMDFCYFGGIYRDCWLIATNPVFITDPNVVDVEAGGGIFVSYDEVSGKSAKVRVKTHLQNKTNKPETVKVRQALFDRNEKMVAEKSSSFRINPSSFASVEQLLKVANPKLWHPDSPERYSLKTFVSVNGKMVDGMTTKIGIRSVEMRGADGLYLNGKPFEDKLMGANRHQDYAYIGNAIPNNLHWNDVKKLRDLGFRVIRSAHYPQDPAFMDACDELGMFIIVATPGWQFWNDKPVFEQRVLSDIRNMVRRDRNHPSVFLWEPILNETSFPESFAKKAHDATHAEYPYAGCFTACDDHSKGAEFYDVIYCAPKDAAYYQKLGKSCFTREFGDHVDDWNSHNSYSRAAREWGEHAQIRQAQHYAKKNYSGSLTIDDFYKSDKAHVGGTLWHSFDHQRGYHPDPFWGGLMDAARLPKYSYYMMMSQRDPYLKLEKADSGPMVYIANAMTPFSPEDIVVYTNCDSVRLIINERDTLTQSPLKSEKGIKHPPLVFKDAYSFVNVRALHRAGKPDQCSLVAEAFLDGKVVATSRNMPSKRKEDISLRVDGGLQPVANGSDIIQVVASVTDKDGHIKRLTQEEIVFEVEGEGVLIGDVSIGANPVSTRWGEAVALIRTTHKPGKIKVTCRTKHPALVFAPNRSVEIETIASDRELVFQEAPLNIPVVNAFEQSNSVNTNTEQIEKALKQVEKQQTQFESTER